MHDNYLLFIIQCARNIIICVFNNICYYRYVIVNIFPRNKYRRKQVLFKELNLTDFYEISLTESFIEVIIIHIFALVNVWHINFSCEI